MWPWDSCDDVSDPDLVNSCTARLCERTLRAKLPVANDATIKLQVSQVFSDNQQTTHLFRVEGGNTTRDGVLWARCAVHGTQVVRAGVVSAEVANQIVYRLPGADDL